MTNSLAIRLDGIGKDYGALTAVRTVSLDIGRGEVVALLGPNGAGKSTTIDLALGLARPTRGSSHLFGGDPRAAIVAGRVGAMLQGGALLPTQTVEQAVALIAAAHRNPIPVAEALERARVTDIATQKVSKLSGGQMQRARFAVAIVSNPELLILDEPTAAMDVEARREFWSSIRALTDDGRTVVVATHYLDEADTFADRIVIMSHGDVVADGTPSEIKSVVEGRVLSATVADAASVASRLGERAEVLAVEHRGPRVVVRTRDSDATLRELITAWPDAHDIEVVPRTMDDAFLALTSTASSTTQEVAS